MQTVTVLTSVGLAGPKSAEPRCCNLIPSHSYLPTYHSQQESEVFPSNVTFRRKGLGNCH